MAISLAKNNSTAKKSESAGNPGMTIGLLAGLLVAGAFVAQIYVPKFGGIAFMILAGLAGLVGVFGLLAGVKGLKGHPKGPAIIALLVNVGVLGGVAYGFSKPKAPASTPVAEAPQPTLPTTGVEAPTDTASGTNALAPEINTTTPPPIPEQADENRPIPRTKRLALLRARTVAPKPKPPTPEADKTKTAPKQAKPPTAEEVAGIPSLDKLLPTVVALPPMPRSTALVAQQPRTFRGATLETFDEINLVSKNFQAVNQKLDVWKLLDVAGMNNETVISGRRKQIITWMEQYVAFKTTIERADSDYAERLRAANTSADRLDATISRFRSLRDKTYGPALEQFGRVSQLNTAAEGALRILEENFTAWRIDESGKQILFDNPKIAATYTAAVGKLNEAAGELANN